MPRNRIRLLETIQVTQKTDRSHHKYWSLLVWVLVSSFWRDQREAFCGGDEASRVRGVWGLVATNGPDGPAVVDSIFILKTPEARSASGPRAGNCCTRLTDGGLPIHHVKGLFPRARVFRRGGMRKQAILGLVLVFCLTLGFGASTSLGQAVYGSIIGTVTYPQGNAISGAQVKVTSLTKNTVEETTTNESGNFSVIHLIPDTYRVKIEGAGFKAYDVASVLVQVDTATRVDAQLQVGAVTQTVEVTGEVPQLKTDRADVSIDFSSDYVEKLPLVNRNFQSLLLSVPGTQQIGWNHAATENPQGSQQTFVQGHHFSDAGYELDETDNQNPILD